MKHKPCPFCGSINLVVGDNADVSSARRYYVSCFDCLADGPLVQGSLKAAWAAWDRREARGERLNTMLRQVSRQFDMWVYRLFYRRWSRRIQADPGYGLLLAWWLDEWLKRYPPSAADRERAERYVKEWNVEH